MSGMDICKRASGSAGVLYFILIFHIIHFYLQIMRQMTRIEHYLS